MLHGAMQSPRVAIVRPPGPAYAACLRRTPAAIDVARAMRQHADYVAALQDASVEVVALPVLPDAPDACFVEDTVVPLGDIALATRPGAPARRSEVEAVAASVARYGDVVRLTEPATLDGGDVLRLGRRLFIGCSERTNRAGAEVLASLAARGGRTTVLVTVARALHLQSAATPLDESTIVFDPDALDPAPFVAAGLSAIAAAEPAGANVLALGDRVLVSADAPLTAARLRARGHHVVEVRIDEFHRGDGALTCLSVRIPRPGGWCV